MGDRDWNGADWVVAVIILILVVLVLTHTGESGIDPNAGQHM